MRTDVTVWFVNLSGWPVFIAVVTAVFLCGLGLSLLMTWLGNRSVVVAAMIAVVAVAVVWAAIIGALAVGTRFFFAN